MRTKTRKDEVLFPGNANLPIGVMKIANREIGVPGPSR
jgi:hypothetical protein